MQLAPPSPEGAQQGGASKGKRKAKTSESKEQSETEVAPVDTKREPTVTATVDDKPHIAPDSPVGKSQSTMKMESIDDISEPPSVLTKPVAPLEDSDEGKRLFSETRRMLQLHHEHAMTLAELVERFKKNEDPSLPTAEQLYRSLTKFNNEKEGGSTGVRIAKILQVLFGKGR